MTKQSTPRYIVTDKVTGKGMTINQFKKRGAKERGRQSLTRSEIMKRGLLTRTSLDSALKDGVLTLVTYRHKQYIDRAALDKFLKSIQWKAYKPVNKRLF